MNNKFLVAAIVALVVAITSPVLAQYRSTGDDGITASPKLRERLDERHRIEAIPAKVEAVKMMCPKCTGKVTTRIDYTARGVNKPTVLVASHDCQGCDNVIATTGFGKAAKSTAVHTCAGCGAETLACCSTATEGDAATAGMK